MIDPKRARLPIIRQCTLLHLNLSGVIGLCHRARPIWC